VVFFFYKQPGNVARNCPNNHVKAITIHQFVWVQNISNCSESYRDWVWGVASDPFFAKNKESEQE
jgi:hypothetical protein